MGGAPSTGEGDATGGGVAPGAVAASLSWATLPRKRCPADMRRLPALLVAPPPLLRSLPSCPGPLCLPAAPSSRWPLVLQRRRSGRLISAPSPPPAPSHTALVPWLVVPACSAIIQMGEAFGFAVETQWPDAPTWLYGRSGTAAMLFFTLVIIFPLSMLPKMRKVRGSTASAADGWLPMPPVRRVHRWSLHLALIMKLTIVSRAPRCLCSWRWWAISGWSSSSPWPSSWRSRPSGWYCRDAPLSGLGSLKRAGNKCGPGAAAKRRRPQAPMRRPCAAADHPPRSPAPCPSLQQRHARPFLRRLCFSLLWRPQ